MSITLNELIPLSHNGLAYRSFGMVIVADYGLLAMMPLTDVDGRLTPLIDGCPVQWQEAFAVLSVQADESLVSYWGQLNDKSRALLARFSSSAEAVSCEWRCARDLDWGTLTFVHVSGLRIALDPYRALSSEAFHLQQQV